MARKTPRIPNLAPLKCPERRSLTDWEKYWATHPTRFGTNNHLEQVGKTVHGQPISPQQFQRILGDIYQHLELKSGDVLLDLCCGNGLITACLAEMCQTVVGVDYSEPLIGIARRDHQRDNITYFCESILEMDLDVIKSLGPFNKVLLYECLQHFKKADLVTLLRAILSITSKDALILIGSIPEKDRQMMFYSTPRRRLVAFMRKILGRDAIGTWWTHEEISKVATEYNLLCRFIDQSPELHTAHYRFDTLLQRNDVSSI